MKGKLILFPVGIGGENLCDVLPKTNLEWLNLCHTFIVEELRTARRFLKAAGYSHSIDDTTFHLLNEHTKHADVAAMLSDALSGENIGLLSEAGLPCVADPGSLAVREAGRLGIEVVPLVGPSSLMLALMGSGLNGQRFAFNGYLPIEPSARNSAISRLEERVLRYGETQLLIEAPYRNNQMLQALAATLRSETLICVACDITMPSQFIRTLSALRWRKEAEKVNLHKRNTVFLIGK